MIYESSKPLFSLVQNKDDVETQHLEKLDCFLNRPFFFIIWCQQYISKKLAQGQHTTGIVV